jgi:hypothetical protein
MMWLVALTMLLFEGLALCTIGGMVTSGVGTGLAMVTAVFELILGVFIVRAMYRYAQRA